MRFKIWLIGLLLPCDWILVIHKKENDGHYGGVIHPKFDDDAAKHFRGILASCIEEKTDMRDIVLGASIDQCKRYEIDWRNFKEEVEK